MPSSKSAPKTSRSLLGRLLRGADWPAAVKPAVKPARPRRQGFALEALEPRVLLSANLSYGTLSSVHDFTLRATATPGHVFASLYDTTSLSTPLASVELTAPGDVAINVARSGGAAAQSLNGDRLRIDLDSFALLNNFVTANGGTLTVAFAGGLDTGLADDLVSVDASNATLGFGLKVQSSSDIKVDAHAAFAGDLTVLSEALVTGGAVPSTGLLANANAGVSLVGAQLSATGTVSLTAHGNVAVSTNGSAISGVTGAVVSSFSTATVDVAGSTVSAQNLVLASLIDGSLTATAANNTVKLVTVLGKADPRVAVHAGSTLTATQTIAATASSDITIAATAQPNANTDSSVDAAVVNTTFASGATLSVNEGASVTATGTATLTAASKLADTTTADAYVNNKAGAAVAVSVVTGDTTATVAAATVKGSSVTLAATSARAITTTARSSPGGSTASGNGSNASEQTLAADNAGTSAGSISVAGAISVGTDTGTTSASLVGATVNAGAGAASVTASGADTMAVVADGHFTGKTATGVGVGVAIGVANRSTLAFVGGASDVTASSLSVRALAPTASSFSAVATSGAGAASSVGAAGSVALNIIATRSAAYLDTGGALALHGGTDATFAAQSSVTTATSAIPGDGGGDSSKVGIGASFAFSDAEDSTSATLADGVSLTGAHDLILSANATHATQTTARNGGKGGTAVTPVVAISSVVDDTRATLGSGGLLSVAGAFSATAGLRDAVATTATGDTTSSSTGVGISVALGFVHDTALSTTGRDLLAGGAAAFVSSAVSGSQATARASVAGGPADDKSGSQSVDNTAGGEKTFADSTASGKNPGAKGTDGAATPSASTADGTVSVAGAVAVDVLRAQSQALIGTGRSVTSTGALSVLSSANVDGSAFADGSAVAGAAGFNPLTRVDIAADTIDLGTASRLKTGDRVTYTHGTGGTDLGGLTQGSAYFVYDAGGGKFQLYDTAAHAQAHGAAGRIDITSTGGGFKHALKGGNAGGTSVAAAVAINSAHADNRASIAGATIKAGGVTVAATVADRALAFLPSAAVDVAQDTIDAGTSGLRSGDAVRYTRFGGADIDGLVAGQIYFVTVRDDGKLQLYTTREAALAGGPTGLVDLTSTGFGAFHALIDQTDAFAARAVSGAGGGDTGIAGSLAINLAFTDTEALLGVGAAVPTITITGAADVALTAANAVSNVAAAIPSDGGGDGIKVGVGISVAIDDAENTALAVLADNTVLTGARALALSATLTQDLTTLAQGGGKGSTAVTPVVAVTITDNDARATLGAGAALTMTGDLSAQASLTDTARTSALGDTTSDSTGIGISVAAGVVHDSALATTARNLTAVGVAFAASAVSVTESVARASVRGGEQDDGSSQHDGAGKQSVDNTANKQIGAGDAKAKQADAGAKGAQGSSSDKSKTSDGTVSAAGAVAVNLETASSQATIPDARKITASGLLAVTSLANIDGHALATGSAATSGSGVGVGVAVAVDVAHATNRASIGTGTTIAAKGLTVTAGIAARALGMTSTTRAVVDSVADTLFLGAASGLSTGDKVTYDASGGTAIGGLTSGTDYYVAVQGDGSVRLYDTAAHATAGGTSGKLDLTAAGSGTQKLGRGLFGTDVTFHAGGSVRLLAVSTAAGLHIGDAVTYSAGGGTAIGGLSDGTVYYAIELSPGTFQLAATRADAQAGKAIVLTGAGTTAQRLIDATDTFRTEATSGAGGGKVGVAGAVAVNDVTSDTLAVVGLGGTAAVTLGGGGGVTVTAAADQSNVARALPSDGGGKGSSVGVGASVAINSIDNTVRAEITDGTTWSGGIGALTITAGSGDAALTHGENGASGGVAVGVGAAVAVAHDTVTARLGSGVGLIGTGPVTLTATHAGNFETGTGSEAAGSSVGVGASVSVAVIVQTVSAETLRSVTTPGAATIGATSTVVVATEAVASVKGESASDSQEQTGTGGQSGADGQADHQVNGNSTTGGQSLTSAKDSSNGAEGSSSGQSGEGGSGVGVAAAVAVNAITTTTTVHLGNGADVNASGVVAISAIGALDASAKGIGSALAMDNNVNIAAGVGLNVAHATTTAFLDSGTVVKGAGITLQAITPAGTTDDFIAWGAAAGGGKGDVAVAGSVGINVVTLDTQAVARAGSSLISSGDLTVAARGGVNPQTLAAAASFSQGTAVGAAVAIALVDASAVAQILGSADAAGALLVDARMTVAPSTIDVPLLPAGADPSATSIAVAGGASAGNVGVAGAVVIDIFHLTADAGIGTGTKVNQAGLFAATPSQSVTVQALTSATITSIAGGLGVTTGSAGVGGSLDLELLTTDTHAHVDRGAVVSAGGAVGLAATSSETLLSVVGTVGVADTAGVAGSVAIQVATTHTDALLADSPSGTPTQLAAGGFASITATDAFKTTLIAGSIGAAGTAGIGAANTTLVHAKTLLAAAGVRSTIVAAGGLGVSAIGSEDILSIAAGVAVGGTAGVAGSAAVNVLTETTAATIGRSSIVTANNGAALGTPGVVVAAADSTALISVAGSLAVGGSAGVGVGADVATLTKSTIAAIDSGVVADIEGNVVVDANASESVISVAGGVGVGSVGVAIDAGVHVFNLTTLAFIGDNPLDGIASAGPGNVHARGSVAIAAHDLTDINEIVGVVSAGGVGVGAAAGVNILNKTTRGFIGDGAVVTGDGNGFGLTVSTGAITTGLAAPSGTYNPGSPGGQGIQTNDAGAKSAAAGGDRSSFRAAGHVQTPSLGKMDLTNSGSQQTLADDSLSGERTTGVGNQFGFHGVAVAADNRDEIRTFTVSLAAGSVAVAVSAGVDVVHADTEATIGAGAKVNASLLGANAGQSVLVGAGDDFYHLAVAATLAVGGVGVAPAVGVNVIANTTRAAIGDNATVNAVANIAVGAAARENVVMVGVGIAAGSVGVGAVVDVLSIANHVTAAIGAAATVHAGGDLVVAASDDTHVFALSGALAAGVVGVGGAVGVVTIDKSTLATIGAGAHADGLGYGAGTPGVLDGTVFLDHFGTTTGHGVVLQASSTEDIAHIVATGGFGYVGVSGAVGVTLVSGETDAIVGAGAQVNLADPANASAAQNVAINAADAVTSRTYMIGIAGGFVGVAGAVDVGTVDDNVDAEIAAGAAVRAKNDVAVNGLGRKDLQGFTASGAGGFVGVGGAVSVWSIGTAVQKGYSDNDGHSASAVDGNNGKGAADANAGQQAQSGTGLVTGQLGGFGGDGNANTSRSRVASGTAAANAGIAGSAPTQASIAARENAVPVPPGTAAVVRAGASVTAGHDIQVNGAERAQITEIAGQFAGGVVGAGASVAVLSVADNVTAAADGTLSAGHNIVSRAILNEAVTVTALDGSVGFVGLGAAVVVLTDNSQTQASLGNVGTGQSVAVYALSSRNFTETTGQMSIGAVGVGASFTKLSIGGGAYATVDAGAVIGQSGAVGSLTVQAIATVTTKVTTVAITAGIGAFSANFALVDVHPRIVAVIGDHAHVTAIGAVSVGAGASLDDVATTTGVSAGGLAVGVSYTRIATAPVVTAALGNPDDSTIGAVAITAGALTVQAVTVVPASGYIAQALATGSVGALIGVTSTNTVVTNTSSVRAFVANGAGLAIAGATLVSAVNSTRQKATSDSNAGGLIAAGIATASASSDTDTEAFLGGNVNLVGSSLAIGATSSDDDFAGTNAGSGGLIAGAAAIAHTSNTSVTHAAIGAGSLGHVDVNRGAGTLDIHAEHTATFNAQVSAVAGGLFAGAGADIVNTVAANTQASVGANVFVVARSISMGATSHANKPWLSSENIHGTTGGLVSGAGGADHTTIAFTTQVTIGDGAHLEVPGVAGNAHQFRLSAQNEFAVYDKVAFETGGALSGAHTNASIVATTDIARVQVGAGATLLSSGAIDMTARGEGELVEDVLADTYGAGTVTTGDVNVTVTPTNEVLIGVNTLVRGYGDLNLLAGTNAPFGYDQYRIEARFDAFAGSLIPISDLDANGDLIQTNNVVVAGGAHLASARQVNLAASRLGIATIVAKAKAVSWVSDVADAILSLTGGGGVEQYNGELLAEAHGTVRNDGTVETGINRQQHLTLTGWNKATGLITAYDASSGVTFTTTKKSISSSLVDELNFDQDQLHKYGAVNPTLNTFYTAEIARITAQLQQMGLLTYQDNGDGTFTAVAVDQFVMTVTVDPIYADAGLIDVRADQLQGSGKFLAPSDAKVTITNATPAYLELLGITIPEDSGGLYFNGVKVTANAAILAMDQANAATDNQFNAGIDGIVVVGTVAFNLTGVSSAGSPAPVIDVENTLDIVSVNANQGTDYTWPDIIVLGPASGGVGLHNLQGDVILKTKTPSNPTSKGNIKIFGPIEAKNLTVVAGGDVFIDGVSTYEVGGSPYAAWGPATTGTYNAGGTTAAGVVAATPTGIANTLAQVPTGINLYGDRVHISADFININGTIQSGKSDETLVLDVAAINAIKQILTSGASGVIRLVGIANDDFDVFFDTATHRIEVQDMRVGGGYVDLTGHVVNTGNGQVNVLGGYGSINIVNNTGFDLGVHRLDVSQQGAGTLIITDTAKGSVSNPYVTLYKQFGTSLQTTTDNGSGPITSFGALDTVYNPGSFWRYGWTVGVSQQEIKTVTLSSSNWLGLINLGKTIDHWDTIEVQGVPKLVGAGPYYYRDIGNFNQYHYNENTVVTSDTGPVEVYHHSESTWYGENTYTAEYQEVTGEEVYHTHDISASRPIGIHFLGGTEANVSVSSLTAVYLEGAILNPTGTTTITAGTTITAANPAALVGGRIVELTAGSGIGTHTTAVRVNVSQQQFVTGAPFVARLDATTAAGEINLEQVLGTLPVGRIASNDQSLVRVTSQAGISVGRNDVESFAQGLVAGGDVILAAGLGGIGNGIYTPLQVTLGYGGNREFPTKGLLTASAQGNIAILDPFGDMRVNTVSTPGDVWLSTNFGSILDGNSIAQTDERTVEQLRAGVWTDLQLTAGTGYDQKVADTLAAYVTAKTQEYRTYWQFRLQQPNHGTSYDASYQVKLTAAEDSYYRGTLGYTDAQIAQFVTDRTTQYHILNATYGALGNTYKPSFTYAPTAAETATLVAGIKEWTEDQLLQLFGAGLLKTVTSTVVTTEAPNIVARNVTLVSSRTIGEAGGNVTIDVTKKPVVFTPAQLVTLNAAERLDVQYLGGATIATVVDFNAAAHTIRRTDGGSWLADGLKIGMDLTIAGNGQNTSNATTGNLFYHVVGLTADTITVASSPTMTTQTSVKVTVAPVVLDPTFQALGAPVALTVQFVGADTNGPARIVRGDGGSFVADGFQAGQRLRVTGSAENVSAGSIAWHVVAVTATTITLGNGDYVLTTGSEAVTLTAGTLPLVTAIQVAQSDDLNVDAGGVLNASARGKSVLLGSAIDVNVGRITVGDQYGDGTIRLRGAKNILDGLNPNAAAKLANIFGRVVLLEAAQGVIGLHTATVDDPITLDQLGQLGPASITARAFGTVALRAVAGTGPGDLSIESVFSATGDAWLRASGSIFDVLQTDFTKVKAKHIDLTADRGMIGTFVNGIADYLDVDASSTVTATAASSVGISQTNGDLRVDHIINQDTDSTIDLRAAGSILDYASSLWDASGDPSRPAADVIGGTIKLTALGGSIGTASNALDISMAYFGDLTASAKLDIFVNETANSGIMTGDLHVRSVIAGGGAGGSRSVFLTAVAGDIDDSGTPPVVEASFVSLTASGSVGDSTFHVIVRAPFLETQSGAATYVDDWAATTLGSTFSGRTKAVSAGGVATITSLAGITVAKSLIAAGSLSLIAVDDAKDGTNPATGDVPDNIQVNALDVVGTQLSIRSAGSVVLAAGDDLTVKAGSLVQAGTSIIGWGDYQAGRPSYLPPLSGDADPHKGGKIQLAGTMTAQAIIAVGGADADTITISGQERGQSPWTAATYPAFFTAAGVPFPATPSTTSLVGAAGQGGDDTITVSGTVIADDIEFLGGDGNDTIAVNPTGTAGHDAVLTGHIQLLGGAGDDTILLHRLNTLDAAHKLLAGSGPTTLVTGLIAGQRLTADIDGGDGSDRVQIDLTATNDSIVNVHDTGAIGTDGLFLTSGGSADTYLLRSDFVTLLQVKGTGFATTFERVNIDGALESLDIDSGAGRDRFVVDDTAAATTLHGGADSDTFQFGQLFGADRIDPATVAAGDAIATTVTTAGRLSRGTSHAVNVFGGTGDDQTVVYANQAALVVSGEDGNDSLTVRGFLDGGTLAPVSHAAISFDGGKDTNSATLVGTERADTLAVTPTSLSGAGLAMKLANTTRIEVDAMGGDDVLAVTGTAAGTVTTLIGGLGSDRFDLGGTGPAAPHRASGLAGTVLVEGDTLVRDRSLKSGLRLPTETDSAFPAGPPTSDASPKTDTVNLFDDANTADATGTLGQPVATDGLGFVFGQSPTRPEEFGRVAGLGMGGTVSVNVGSVSAPSARSFDGGVTFHGMEFANVLLGQGHDKFSVTATVAGTVTVVQGGGGNDALTATGGGGAAAPLVLLGDTTQDGSFYDGGATHARPFVKSGNDTIDASADPNGVVIYGGAGDDSLTGSGGGDWILGGSGKDTIKAGNGADIVSGDDGMNLDLSVRLDLSGQILKIANAAGAVSATADALTARSDQIDAGSGANIVFGDHGTVTQVAGIRRIITTGSVLGIATVLPADGQGDVIAAAGGSVILGGSGGDTITSLSGNNVVLGDSGQVLYSSPGVRVSVTATDMGFGSADTIKTGSGNDVIVGGPGTDTIDAGGGSNTVLPDGGTTAKARAAVQAIAPRIAWTPLPASAPDTASDGAQDGGWVDDFVSRIARRDTLHPATAALRVKVLA